VKEISLKRSDSMNWWAVTLKNDINHKLIGHISLSQTDLKILRTWEIGYIFNPDYHNQGYATEACRELINYVFRNFNAHRIVAYCSPANPASWRVLEKCGMTKEGLLRKNTYFRTNDNGDPIWLDSFQYAILADDER
jgi:RimJ/RimL family protein N-acetyltransferase